MATEQDSPWAKTAERQLSVTRLKSLPSAPDMLTSLTLILTVPRLVKVKLWATLVSPK